MDLLVHLPRHGIIVCSECKYAVLPSHINSHFSNKRKHKTDKKARDSLIQRVAAIDGLIPNDEVLKSREFEFPEPTALPIPALGKPKTNGLKCTLPYRNKKCGYICCSLQQMQEHCFEVHDWKSTNKGGRPKNDTPAKESEQPWETGIHCQRFFKQGARSGYFQVRCIAETIQQAQIASRDDQLEAKKQILTTRMNDAKEEERRKITESEESMEPSPWLKRMYWAGHTAGLDKRELRALGAQPGGDEKDLQVLCKAFDWLIQDSQYHADREVVGLEALFEANKKEVNTATQMPFDSWMDITTIERYTEVCKAILRIIFRAAEEGRPEKRPPYQLTATQEMNIQHVRISIVQLLEWKGAHEPQEEVSSIDTDEEESSEEIEMMGKIQREILRLWISLLNHPLQDNEYKSALISAMAVLGIREDDGWFDAEDYTPKFSAVIKLSRLMVIQDAWEQRREKVHIYQDRGWNEAEINDTVPSHYQLVQKSVSIFMTMAHGGRNPTPMQWLYRSRSYGFKIRYTTAAAGKVQWIGDDFLYSGMRFSIHKFRGMVHGLVAEAREILFRKLLMVEMNEDGEVDARKVPPINWDQLVDNLAETRVGWSFLDDERNQFAVDGKWWLYDRIFKEQTLREKWLDENGQIIAETADKFEEDVEEFLERIWALKMELSQPARARELLTLRKTNTPNGGVRNIGIDEGMVSYTVEYHKGYRSSGNIKRIHRFLPREAGTLWVYFMWLVDHFRGLVKFERTGKIESSAFVWGDGQKKEYRQWTGPKKKQNNHDRASRQVAIPPAGQGGSSMRPGEEGGHNRERESVGGPRGERSSAPPRRNKWTSERGRKILKEAAFRYMGVKGYNISVNRHFIVAASRRYCKSESFKEEKDTFEDDEVQNEDEDEDDPWDLQCGHTSHVGAMIYARELQEASDSMVNRREKFRRVSHAWHCWLGFPSAEQGVAMGGRAKRKRQIYEEEMQDAQITRWKRLRGVDIQVELEKMFGGQARFRGLQEPVLQAIMKHYSPIVVIMATSMGKSLMYELPAKCIKHGTTVVVTPLVSLQNHMVEKCQKMGISCVKWNARESHAVSQIVMVTPESAVSKTFGTFLDRLQGMCQLDRIVFDEAHSVLDSTADFRPKMRWVGNLMSRGVQMVYLTATLPPHEEDEWMEIMKIRKEEAQIFRDTTTRPKIAYSVLEFPVDEEGQGEIEAACQLVQRKMEEYPAPAKIIIYSSSITTTKELGAALDCHMYYRDVGDIHAKEEIRRAWESADGRVVVATSAFGLGIDRPDVRVVIHVGPIFQMRNYVQESGRAGRDRQRSEAIIMVPEGRQESLQKRFEHARVSTRICDQGTKEGKRRIEMERMERFISGSKCRRIHLDQQMDGRMDRIRCEAGEERCDVCQQSDAMMEQLEQQRQAWTAQEQVRDGEASIDNNEAPSDDELWTSPGPGLRIEGKQTMPERPAGNTQQQEWQGSRLDSGIDIPSSSNIDELADRMIDERDIRSSEWTRSSPPRGIISLDHGFGPAGAQVITEADRAEFQAQQVQRWQQRDRVEEQNRREGFEVQDVRNKLDQWVGKCPICYIDQCQGEQVDAHHSLEECPENARADVMAEATALGKIMFEQYAACYECGVAQQICSRWRVMREGNQRFQRVKGGTCQYGGVVRAVVAAMMVIGPPKVVEEHIFQKMKAVGIWVPEGSSWDEKDKKQVREAMRKWLGRRVQWGFMESSVLLQVFYRITVGFEGWVQGSH